MDADAQKSQSESNGDRNEAPDDALPEQFAVVDAKKANIVVRRIVETRAYAQSIDEWAEVERQRCADLEVLLLERYGAQLEAFALTAITDLNQRLNLERRACIRLPAGTLGFRVQSARLRIEDEQTAVEWCRLYLPEAISVTERVSRVKIHEFYEHTGQVADGTGLEEECIRFYVK